MYKKMLKVTDCLVYDQWFYSSTWWCGRAPCTAAPRPCLERVSHVCSTLWVTQHAFGTARLRPKAVQSSL